LSYFPVSKFSWRFGLVGLTALTALLVFAFTIQDFLAVNLPVVGNILVVEGWIWDSSAMREATEEFSRGQYEYLVTVGGPIEGDKGPTNQRNLAELAARRLRELGVAEASIIVLNVPDVTFHRTYASAFTLKNWINDSKIEVTGVNVFTLGAHARKSLVLFKRALGPGTKVGVISGTDTEYDPTHWWLSARGIYVILRKTVGYLYAIVWPLPDSLPLASSQCSPLHPLGLEPCDLWTI